jgi:hypothetical protein
MENIPNHGHRRYIMIALIAISAATTFQITTVDATTADSTTMSDIVRSIIQNNAGDNDNVV